MPSARGLGKVDGSRRSLLRLQRALVRGRGPAQGGPPGRNEDGAQGREGGRARRAEAGVEGHLAQSRPGGDGGRGEAGRREGGAGLLRQGDGRGARGGGEDGPVRRQAGLPHASPPLGAPHQGAQPGDVRVHHLPRRAGRPDQGRAPPRFPPRRGRPRLERPAHRRGEGDGPQVQGRVHAVEVRQMPHPAIDALARAAALEGQEALHRRRLLGLPSDRGLQRPAEARPHADQHRQQDHARLAADLDRVPEGLAAGDADAEFLARRGGREFGPSQRIGEARRGDGPAAEAAWTGSLRRRRLSLVDQREGAAAPDAERRRRGRERQDNVRERRLPGLSRDREGFGGPAQRGQR